MSLESLAEYSIPVSCPPVCLSAVYSSGLSGSAEEDKQAQPWTQQQRGDEYGLKETNKTSGGL